MTNIQNTTGIIYDKNDGLKYELQCRCNGISTSIYEKECELPLNPSNRKEYLDKFNSIEEYMNRNWHEEVNLGAALNSDGLLTDHGVKHVQSVIQHAYDIISNVRELTGYEIFLLLVAIHFHDVGNIYGRAEHETKIAEIIEDMGTTLSLNAGEKDFVSSIATAHGGYCLGDKDTISGITADDRLANITVRPKVLAAILRFADEISEDYGRSFQHVTIPPESQAYHYYAQSLQPISISGNTLKMCFRIPYEYTQEEIQKGKHKLFLYDEIKNRLAKCMRELEYCRKYTADLIKIRSISVTIYVCRKGASFRIIEGATEKFRLTLQGYPNENSVTFDSYLEKDDSHKPIELKYENGADMKEKIEKGDL